jgi:alkanesulfonate monooxygenase SsuD/methylene tetrahydromethanopterin reductase-like flavin-dependent oxidoreductase (luciferase family)
LAAAKGLPHAFASHFAPAQLQTAISIYRNNFKPSFQLSEPYVIACNVIAAETDTEANRLATSFKKTIFGIITGNRQQLQPPVASDSEFWDQWKKPLCNK